MMETKEKNCECWADFWDDATCQATNRGPMQAGFWNHMSVRFGKNISQDREKNRFNMILSLIEGSGISLDGAQVLDIGAGTGSIAIPLAKKGARVTAVDFSEGMLKRLEERANEEHAPMEQILMKSWDTIDLDAEGFRKKFDLVIASMTPAVRTPHDFRLMLDASKGICYYSGWVQRKWDSHYYDLYRLLFQEDFREGTHGFYLPFMYLYMMGYHPTVQLSQDEWDNSETIDEAVETISGFFSTTKTVDTDVKTRIRDFISTKSSNGMYQSKSFVTTGMMVWDMRETLKGE